MQKTSKFKTQCKGDISHAFETAKITVFYPTVCKTPDVPYIGNNSGSIKDRAMKFAGFSAIADRMV